MNKSFLISIIFIQLFLQQNLKAIDEILLADKIEVGPGLSSRKSVYIDQGLTTVAVPIIIINYGDFYAEGDKAAYILSNTAWQEINFWTEAIGIYRQQGFLDAKGALNDLDDRKDAIELGFALGMVSENFGVFNLALVYDVINTHKGHELALKYEAPMVWGNWIVRPVLSIQYMSHNLAHYYFGVNSHEIIAGRALYIIDKAINYSFGYDLKYLLSDKWRITHSLDLTRLDQTITDSPIVRYQENIQFSISLVYDFL